MTTHDNSRFSMFRGDTRRLHIAITDSNGDDVSTDDATAVAFGLFDISTKEAVVLKALNDGITLAGNVVTVLLDAADTEALLGTYLFELQFVDVSGFTYTILRGEATIHADLITPEVLA